MPDGVEACAAKSGPNRGARRGWISVRPGSLGHAISWATAVIVLLAVWQVYGWHPTAIGGDASNYLAAGERLNAEHPLYALLAGDRPVPLHVPYWSVPLLAPPPVAVLWRPLALLGDAGMILWDAAAIACVVGAAWALRSAPWAVALLSAPLAASALSGNASAFVLAAFVLAWICRDRPWIVGALVAGTAAVKLSPIVLLVWLIATRRWHAIAAALVVGASIFGVGIVGAGLEAWFDWLRAIPSSVPSPLAIATLTGLSPWAVAGLGVTGVSAIWATKRSDRSTFAAAVVVASLATPALYFATGAALLAAVAPLALRSRGVEQRDSEGQARTHEAPA